MRKLAILLSLVGLLYAAPALGEVYTDMVSLSQAVAAAQKDTTFTLGADLYAAPEDCIIRNTSKAVITLDGQGHSVDYFLFTDGTFELVNMEADLCVLTSQKKSNTVALTLGADAKVGTVGFDGDAAGHLILRNAGFVQRAVSNGTAAAITIENTGLMEGPSAVQIMDQRMVNYKSVKSGKVTIKNDGVIRGLTGAGMILAPFDGTTMSLAGSGVVEGPVGLILCANSAPGRATVTIDHTLRSCNARLEAEADQRADFWLEIRKQANKLGLLTPSEEEALTVPFQRKVRESQIDLLLERTGMTHEDALGRALCISQGSRLPFNLKLTLKGTLWGERGLITLPDMNQKKGSLSVKAQIAPDSPAKRVDIVYAQHMLDINESTWPKKLSSLVNSSFTKAWQKEAAFCTRTVKPSGSGGAVYTSGWAGPAMVELAARHTGGQWQVTRQDLPSPGKKTNYLDVLSQLSAMAENSLYEMEADASVSSTDNDYAMGAGSHIWDGKGYAFGTPFESKNYRYPAQMRLSGDLTIRNFSEFGKLVISERSKHEGKVAFHRIGGLGEVTLSNVEADLADVTIAPDAELALSAHDKGVCKVVIHESCTAPNGFLKLSSGDFSNNKSILEVVNNADLRLTPSQYSAADIVAAYAATIKVTGNGSLGDWETAHVDRKPVTVTLTNGGKVVLEQRIAALRIKVYRSEKSTAKSVAQVGGQVKHLLVECDGSTSKDTITISAGEMETFKVELSWHGRTEPITDKEAASFIKANAPALKYTKARSAGNEKIQPVYEIKNDQGSLLWTGTLR